MNLTDFMKGDDSGSVLVKGIGKMSLNQAKKRVKDMLNDLSNRVDNLTLDPGQDPSGWNTVDVLLKRGTIQAYLDAISSATKQQ